MIETIILCTLFGVFVLLAFEKGINIGMRMNNANNEHSFNVKKPFFRKKTSKEEEHLNEINRINLENIEAYDGTGLGQRDFPEE